MPNYPKIQESAVQCRSVDTFYGYDRHLKIQPGALYGMTNLTSDHFPLLAERPRRGLLQTVAAPAGLIGREKPV